MMTRQEMSRLIRDRMSTKQTEREMVRDLAQRWLNQADSGQRDPDSDYSAMARQHLRALEKIERLTKLAVASVDRELVFTEVQKELADVWPKATA